MLKITSIINELFISKVFDLVTRNKQNTLETFSGKNSDFREVIHAENELEVKILLGFLG